MFTCEPLPKRSFINPMFTYETRSAPTKSRRDELADIAFSILLDKLDVCGAEKLAKLSYEYADAMLKESRKPKVDKMPAR